MAKTLTYRDAVRLLGGDDSAVVTAVDRLTSGLMLGASITVPGVVAWFDYRAEFAQQSRRLVAASRQRGAGSHRLGRTRQLAAAHTVIVVAAYFEVLGEAQLPIQFKDLNLDRAEQLAVAGGGPADRAASLAASVLTTAVALPVPHGSHDRYLEQLGGFYGFLSDATLDFVSGLAIWEDLRPWQREQLARALSDSAVRARERYEDMFADLVRDFPEIAHWANLREHRSTAAAVQDATKKIDFALQGIATLLTTISSQTPVVGVRAKLERAAAAALPRPIADSAAVPSDLSVPTLKAGYVPPPFRATEGAGDGWPSDEAFWASVPVRTDLDEYLVGYLTSPGATATPMLLLGQPGAGKSVLTKVLAAQLPAADFLAIRVVLREVDATLDLQGQIEYALRGATGDEIRWPTIAEAADGALPVVLLDGFDELLQATGVNQSNYLREIARFQQREEEQGRAVAVVVTTRTSVADRAWLPPGTALLRLEPFDPPRTRRWLDVWNAENDSYFRTARLRPLDADVVLGYPDLACQPLLLLLLALYDADANALQQQRLGDPLSLGDLYERLLRSFARREVDKLADRLGVRDVETAIDWELRQLSIAAFAMFNRSSQWVSQADLERDLAAVNDPRSARFGRTTVDGLMPSELLLGRFFFIHRARAVHRGDLRQTYEFLHATFGEYLVARLTWELLRDIGTRNLSRLASFSGVDHGRLYTFLSFVVLTVRTPTVTFLTGMAAGLADEERRHFAEVLGQLYTAAPYDWRPDPVGAYQPVRLPGTARLAAYTANLVVLAAVVAGEVPYSVLCANRDQEAGLAWHDQTLFWHSQLPDDAMNSLVNSLTIARVWTDDGERDIRIRVAQHIPAPSTDPHWTFSRPRVEGGETAFIEGLSAGLMRRRTHFQCGEGDDIVRHVIDPLMDSPIETSIRTFVDLPETTVSAAQALLTAWLSPTQPHAYAQLRGIYQTCAQAAARGALLWDAATQTAYTQEVLAALAADEAVPADIAAEVLQQLPGIDSVSRNTILRCVSAILTRTDPSNPARGALAATVLDLVNRYPSLELGELTYYVAAVADGVDATVEPAHPTQATSDAGVGAVAVAVGNIDQRLATAIAALQDTCNDLNDLDISLAKTLTGSTNTHGSRARQCVRVGGQQQRKLVAALAYARHELAQYLEGIAAKDPVARAPHEDQ